MYSTCTTLYAVQMKCLLQDSNGYFACSSTYSMFLFLRVHYPLKDFLLYF